MQIISEVAQLTTCLFLGFTVSFATKHKAKNTINI